MSAASPRVADKPKLGRYACVDAALLTGTSARTGGCGDCFLSNYYIEHPTSQRMNTSLTSCFRRWGGCTKVLHAVVATPLTMRTREDGASLLSKRFLMVNSFPPEG